MKRREFIALTGGAAVWPLVARAQQPVRMRHIGVLASTAADDPESWLRAGEATERLLLELTRKDWVASPVTQAVEVPLTRTRLRSALTWDAHPQILLRIGRAEPTPSSPRRRRSEVVANSRRQPPPPPPAPHETPHPVDAPAGHRPVSDGRGGTTWT